MGPEFVPGIFPSRAQRLIAVQYRLECLGHRIPGLVSDGLVCVCMCVCVCERE